MERLTAVGAFEPPPAGSTVLYDGLGIEELDELWCTIGTCPNCATPRGVELRAWVLGPNWSTPTADDISADALDTLVQLCGLDPRSFDGRLYLSDANRLSVFARPFVCGFGGCSTQVLHLVSYGEFQPARYMSFNLGAVALPD